jgi:Mce-associated membrane protein
MASRLKGLSWRAALPWALAVIFLGTAVTFGVMWQQALNAEAEREEVSAAAREFVLALTNFSAETIEEDAEHIRSFAVGDFAEEARTFFGEEAIGAIREAEAVSSGEVERLFVQSIEDDQASAFAVVSETITNRATQEPTTDTLRLEVGMIKTQSGWRVNRVDVFQSPGTTTVPGLPTGS